MRAELRSLQSLEAPDGLDAWRPDDPSEFAILVEATIGPAGDKGGEIFGFTVCTPGWVAAHPGAKGFELMHGYVVVPRWDLAVLRRAISDLCRNSEGASWTEVATRLSRFGSWEFEDYREAT